MADEPKKPRGRRGCLIGAIVLLLVLGVVIVVPGFLASGRASNKRNASASLKTLASAEADFRSNDRDDNKVNDYWVGDVSRLYYLESRNETIKLIERSVANADGAPKGSLDDPGPKAGYLYAAIPLEGTGAPYDRGGGRNPEKYAFCAYPAKYQPKAWHRNSLSINDETFIINEDNVIWKKDIGGAAVRQWPKDPLAEGWSKLD